MLKWSVGYQESFLLHPTNVANEILPFLNFTKYILCHSYGILNGSQIFCKKIKPIQFQNINCQVMVMLVSWARTFSWPPELHPTNPFTIFKAQNPSIDDLYLVWKHWSTDSEALKCWKGRSGIREIDRVWAIKTTKKSTRNFNPLQLRLFCKRRTHCIRIILFSNMLAFAMKSVEVLICV